MEAFSFFNSSVFLLSLFTSHCRIVWISFYLETSSHFIFNFLWPDSTSLYKKKMAAETRLFIFLWIILFWLENISLHLLILSSFNLRSLLNQKLSILTMILKTKFCFRDWQINVAIFANAIRLHLPPNWVKNATKIWNGDKVNLFLTQNEKNTSLNFIFCIPAPTFLTHMP